MRKILAGLALAFAWSLPAHAYVGFAGGAFLNFNNVEVPDVVGQANSAAADVILEGVGLDLGTVTARCSAQPLNEVLSQDPAAGMFVALGTLVDVDTSDGMACLWDLTGIPVGWYTIPNVLADQDFVALMRQEADGNGVWAYWQPGTTIRGSSQLQLNIPVIRSEASGSATWARWSPGTLIRNTGNLQLNMQEALNNDFQ